MMTPKEFPPRLEIGSRVWSFNGYKDHGRLEGPKVSISGNMGGTIRAIENPYITMDSLLYTVEWDNGQRSKHYGSGLCSIGRFETYETFLAAIEPLSGAKVTVGPQGGFREATLTLSYDGETQTITIHDHEIWGLLEPKVKCKGLENQTIQLPRKERKRGECFTITEPNTLKVKLKQGVRTALCKKSKKLGVREDDLVLGWIKEKLGIK